MIVFFCFFGIFGIDRQNIFTRTTVIDRMSKVNSWGENYGDKIKLNPDLLQNCFIVVSQFAYWERQWVGDGGLRNTHAHCVLPTASKTALNTKEELVC